jgi:hypothetical protein
MGFIFVETFLMENTFFKENPFFLVGGIGGPNSDHTFKDG